MAKKRPWNRNVLTPPDRRPPKPERDSQGRVQTAEAAQALARLRGPAVAAHVGIKVNACEGFAPYNKQRRLWIKKRMGEMGTQYEELTTGVGAAVRAAGWCYAFSEWLFGKAAETGDAGLAVAAAQLAEKGSRQDNAARTIADAEAKLRRKQTKRPDVSALLTKGESK